MLHAFAKTVEKLKQENLDAILVQNPCNVNWFCPRNHYYIPGVCLVTQEKVYVAAVFRYLDGYSKQYADCPEMTFIHGRIDTLLDLCREKGLKRVGYESAYVTVHAWKSMDTHGLDMVATVDFFEYLRAVKTPEEIQGLREAAAVSDRAFALFLERFSVGMTELQAKGAFIRSMYDAGADDLSFECLLSSGYRCFLPHAISTDKVIEKGEMMLIDFGIMKNGFATDTTRTLFIGKATPEFTRKYEAVLAAQKAAIAGMRDGVTNGEADALARAVIDASNEPGVQNGGLGHGVGMVVHERPSMPMNGTVPLRENMVMAVEPGIYREGWGGIRIEDMVIVGKETSQYITQADRSLVEIY